MSDNIIQSGVLQWKFTSCEFNIEGRSGFSTFSMSDGLTGEDKDDLVKFAGGYSAPDGLPAQPVTEEEFDQFPIAFASFKLRSGKRAITRTRYVGKDYAGARFGNLFSHGLILPEGENWNFHPIQLWDTTRNSTLWTDGLTEEEQHLGRTPDPLPTVNITEEHLLLLNSDVEELLDNENRFEWFPSLFAAVRDQGSNKSVIMRDELENMVKWIAAVQFALPVYVSQEITFQTYCRTSQNASRFHLAGTSLEGSAFQFGSPNLTTQFFPFDFASFAVEKHPKTDCRLVKTNRFSREQHPSRELQNVYDFAAKYGHVISPFDTSLDEAVLLYDLFVPLSCSLNNEDFDTALKSFQKLDMEAQQRILEDNGFFSRKRLDFLWFQKSAAALITAVYFGKTNIELQKNFEAYYLQYIYTYILEFNPEKLYYFLGMLHKNPGKARIIDKFLQNRQFDLESMKIVFPELFPIIQELKDPALFQSFVHFFIRHFEQPISEGMDQDTSKKFEFVNKLVNANPQWYKFGDQLLDYIAKQKNPKQLFLQFYLLFALYAQNNREFPQSKVDGMMGALFSLESKKVCDLSISILPFAIDRATLPSVHQFFDTMFLEFDVQIDKSSYFQYLLSYGTENWRQGKEAKPQATAFMEYILKGDVTFNRWTQPAVVGGKAEIAVLFEQGIRRIPTQDEKGLYRNNIKDILKPLIKDKNYKRLDILCTRIQFKNFPFYKRLWKQSCNFLGELWNSFWKWKFFTIPTSIAVLVLILWYYGAIQYVSTCVSTTLSDRWNSLFKAAAETPQNETKANTNSDNPDTSKPKPTDKTSGSAPNKSETSSTQPTDQKADADSSNPAAPKPEPTDETPNKSETSIPPATTPDTPKTGTPSDNPGVH